MKKTLAIIRSTKFGADERALVDAIRPYFGDQIVLARDARQNEHFLKKKEIETLDINDRSVEDLGLAAVRDWGWRCGDYFQIAAANAFPEFEYFWMVEPDVFFNVQDINSFFKPLEERNDDFLACGYGPRRANWIFYRSVSFHFERVFGCLFPLTRISARAVEKVHEDRQNYSHVWSNLPKPERPVFANDESLVCSSIESAGFLATSIETILPDLFRKRRETFTSKRLIVREDVCSKPESVLHPVVRSVDLSKKIRGKVNPGTLPLLIGVVALPSLEA